MLVKKVIIDRANRLYQMPPDLLAFASSGKQKRFVRQPDLIDLARFIWPVSFSEDQVSGLSAVRPASAEQIGGLREEIAAWMMRQHQVRLQPDKEIFLGGRISDLVGQLALAYIDPGDIAFVPSLGIPLYRWAVTAASGEAIAYVVSAKQKWIPHFDRLSSRLGPVARMLFLNSPHNPTGAELNDKQLAELAWLAGRQNVLLVNDATHGGISSRTPASLLGVRGGKRVGVELYSFASNFGLPALPFAFAVGNREVLGGLRQLARLRALYLPEAYVDLAIQAIRGYPSNELRESRENIARSLAATSGFLDQLGADPDGYPGVPFVWARLQSRVLSVNLARRLFKRQGILIIPGSAFGESGEGYVRLSLTAASKAYALATERLRKSPANNGANE